MILLNFMSLTVLLATASTGMANKCGLYQRRMWLVAHKRSV
uniref:Uncharacterized protein n=1 Tax=Anguilla anguilla TaxID=7936 RepID=A0A0E9U260_ANGAN